MIDSPTLSTPVTCSHIAILEARVDEAAAELSRLGRILAALRSEKAPASKLAAIICATHEWAAPSFEVIQAPPAKCIHGLREAAWCAICKEVGNQDHLARRKESRGLVVGPWQTFMWPPACPREEARFSTMVFDKRGAKDSAGCAHNDGFKKKSVVRVVNASEDRSGYAWQNGVVREIRDGVVHAIPAASDVLEIGYGYKSRTEPKFAVLTPEECEQQARSWKAVHGIQDSANFITRAFAEEKLWVNWCSSCQEYVEQKHDCETWCEKKVLAESKRVANSLAEHQAEACKIERQRVRAKERYLATLTAQGLNHPIDDPMALVKLGVLREIDIENGGHRVSTRSNEGGSDSNSRDYRAGLIFATRHPEKRVARVWSICKREVCGRSFVAVRKGQVYCSKNCCNRHGEETKQGEK